MIITTLASRERIKLIRKSRAFYWDAEHSFRVVCTVSKRYTKKGNLVYWYAYHQAWDNYLMEGIKGYFVLGCMDLDFAFAIPVSVLQEYLPDFNTTTRFNDHYWHVKIVEPIPGNYVIQLRKPKTDLPLDPFKLYLLEKDTTEG